MRIAVIHGHPDNTQRHFGHELADSYAQGAVNAGHEVRRLVVADMDFPLLRSQEAFQSDQTPADIREAQSTIQWAQHMVLEYPLWLGTMPALLKGFLEQAFRPGFAIAAESTAEEDAGSLGGGLLKGRSARIIVTMGMPGFFYRLYFRAHSLKSLERNILRFSGIKPVRASVIGMVEAVGDARRQRWLRQMERLGSRARECTLRGRVAVILTN